MGWFSSIASNLNRLLSTNVTGAGVGSALSSLGGAALGGGLSFLGAQQQASAARDAAEAQAAGIQRAADFQVASATPFNVGSLGGTAEFDVDNKVAGLNLSPELSNIYQGLLSRSGLFGDQAATLGTLDPFEAGEAFYQQQQEYMAPDEQRMREDLETRLLNQGRLGATGGQLQQQKLDEAILRGQGERRTGAMTQAQALIETLLGRETGDINQAVGLLQVPLAQAQLGRGISSNLSQGVAPALASRSSAIQGLNQARAISPTGMSLSSLGNMFLTPQPSKT